MAPAGGSRGALAPGFATRAGFARGANQNSPNSRTSVEAGQAFRVPMSLDNLETVSVQEEEETLKEHEPAQKNGGQVGPAA